MCVCVCVCVCVYLKYQGHMMGLHTLSLVRDCLTLGEIQLMPIGAEDILATSLESNIASSDPGGKRCVKRRGKH